MLFQTSNVHEHVKGMLPLKNCYTYTASHPHSLSHTHTHIHTRLVMACPAPRPWWLWLGSHAACGACGGCDPATVAWLCSHAAHGGCGSARTLHVVAVVAVARLACYAVTLLEVQQAPHNNYYITQNITKWLPH